MSEQMELLEKRWRSLCDVFLPVVDPGQPWRMSRPVSERDPVQGWKLHISATILTACDVLSVVGPILRQCDVLYKAPASLLELRRINTGLYYGYSQVGKFITVYPQRVEDAVRHAEELDRATQDMVCPRVPFDRSLHDGSCVSYRYGAFRPRHIDGEHDEDPERRLMIRTPDGSLIPDERTRDAAVPSWEENPFLQLGDPTRSHISGATPLKTTYRAYEAISQRGKGGVYKAINLRFSPAQRCIVKEGRMNGETDWDGTDGFQRIRNEKRILERLVSFGVPVAQVVDYFTLGRTNYLVLESVKGVNLHSMITGTRMLSIQEALRYGAELAKIMGDIHSSGVVWRDCKPLNIIVDEAHRLRPLDFEGACLAHEVPAQPWGTFGYTPPEWLKSVEPRYLEAEDLYALGATLHHIFSGRPPGSDAKLPAIGSLRRGVPPEIRRIIASLADTFPSSRPAATVVADAFYSSLGTSVLHQSPAGD
jgi:class IV lanthipeptide synthase